MRVAVILTARPSYAKLQTVIAALLKRSVDVQLIACASALLEKYGRVVDVVRQQFPDLPITECYSTYEGANLITSGKETGALLTELVSVLSRLSVDTVVVCADRHEVLAAAQAAAYLHLRLCHMQGGETSGSIDQKIRDSITHLADIHCVCTRRAAFRVYGLIGDWASIRHTGCPSIDLAQQALQSPPVTIQELSARGIGGIVDPERDRFIVVLQHPNTQEVGDAGVQMDATLQALGEQPAAIFWPGQDAGQETMARRIRVALQSPYRWRAFKTLAPERFLRLVSQAACVVGNSSAGIRECSYLGVPVVNVGTRQQGRERGPNVVDVPYDATAIALAIRRQMAHGPYPSSCLYGSGNAGEQIAEVICGG